MPWKGAPTSRPDRRDADPAARLQDLAPPNGVVIAPSTDSFSARYLNSNRSASTCQGFGEPVEAYRVVRERPVDSRFEAVRDAALTPLVGRKEEIDLLVGRWQHAKHGEGQVVLLSGESGIGKSRTVQALRERLSTEPTRGAAIPVLATPCR